MKINFIFAWYNLWIGIYFDKLKKKLYILPLPTLGIVLDFSNTETCFIKHIKENIKLQKKYLALNEQLLNKSTKLSIEEKCKLLLIDFVIKNNSEFIRYSELIILDYLKITDNYTIFLTNLYYYLSD